MIQFLKKQWTWVALSFFGALFLIAIGTFWYQARIWPEFLITEHIEHLKNAFDDIHKTAVIREFKYQTNSIDFLNVRSFEGSELGPMNLAYPKKWRGPYFADNPTIQDTYYQIVKTDKGYFITPGNGVKLLNGKKIGTDIILNQDADIEAMIHDPNMLMYNNKPLAAHLIIAAY